VGTPGTGTVKVQTGDAAAKLVDLLAALVPAVTIDPNTRWVNIDIETNDMRWEPTGSANLTQAVGRPGYATSSIRLSAKMAKAMTVISKTLGAPADLHVSQVTY